MSPDKATVLAALEAALHRELEALVRVTAMARDEATSPESRPENAYDTRAIEASYLAAGQGARLVDLRALMAWAQSASPSSAAAVGNGALVEVQQGAASPHWVLIAPRGGQAFQAADHDVRLVSAASPLGEALWGLEAGEEAEVDTPGGLQVWQVRRVV